MSIDRTNSRLRTAWPGLLLLLALLLPACSSAPPYQGMGPEEMHQLGERKFAEEEWDDAIEVLERLIALHPTYDRTVEARLLLARAFFQKEEYVSAAADFYRLVNRYPTHELAPEAAFGVCRSYAALSPIPQRDQEHTELAIDACGIVLSDYPQSPQAEEARRIRSEMVHKLAEKDYLAGEYYFKREFYDSAIIYYEDVVRLYPETRFAPKALLRIVEAYREIGYAEEADEARERLLELYPDSPEAQAVANGE